MNINSKYDKMATEDPDDPRPILIIPYMWIGDFVRGHTVVRVLKQRWPNRPVDLLVTSLCAPLVDYMPGVPVPEKIARLRKMSYVDFLRNVVKVHSDVTAYFLARGGGLLTNQAAGPDTISAWYAYRRDAAGFTGMGLPVVRQRSNLMKDPGVDVAFPDGNHGIARLLIRFASSMVGHWYGGRGLAAGLACGPLAAISAPASATVIGLGRIRRPAMIRQAFPTRCCVGPV